MPRLLAPQKPAMVLVHQMGKVGSQTIEHSLRASDPKLRIERHHYLQANTFRVIEQCIEAEGSPSVDSASLQYQLDAARQCHADLIRFRASNAPLCVISGYRNPISHVIASVFQGLRWFFPELKLADELLENNIESVNNLIHESFRRFVRGQMRDCWLDRRMDYIFRLAVEWFDTEFWNTHGINIYDYRPDMSGVLVIHKNNTRFVVYKLEELHLTFDKVLQQVFGLRKRTLVLQNLSSRKNYHTLYSEFLRRFTPTDEMKQLYYKSKYYQHFYGN